MGLCKMTAVRRHFPSRPWRKRLLAICVGAASWMTLPALALQTQQIVEGVPLSKSPIRKRIEDALPPRPELQPIPADLVPDELPEPQAAEPKPLPIAGGEPTPAKREPTLAKPASGKAAEPATTRNASATRSLRSKSITDAPAAAPAAPATNNPPAAEPLADNPPANGAPVNSREPAPRAVSGDVLPASFQDITPGVTSMATVQEMFGKASQELVGRETLTWTYKIDPFPKVVFVGNQNLVTTIRLHLAKPAPLKEVESELEIATYTPATLLGGQGQLRGQLYPERGVTLMFADKTKPPLVSEIVLEQNTAEHFLIRAATDRQFRYEQNLADLRIAAELAPEDARSHWQRAKLWSAQGRLKEANAALDEALRLEPQSARFQLFRHWLQAEAGQHTTAMQETRSILARRDLHQDVRAVAECQLGKLLSLGTVRQFKEATEHLTTAINLATPLVADRKWETRRTAKEVLLDANLAMASSVAWGNWNSKTEVVPRWLANAVAVAKDLVENDGADPALELRVFRVTFGTFVAIGGDTSRGADRVLELGRKLIAETNDPLRRRQLEWDLGETLCQAMNAARAAKQYDEALTLANNALALIEPLANEREPSPSLDHFVGSLYFTVGSIYAVGKKDHLEAVRWFEKALKRFGDQPQIGSHYDVGQFGERLVSMGVSYWQTDNRETAMKLTKQGAQLVQRAVKTGTLTDRALAIPYGNLASMHQQLGNKDEAHSYATLAAKLESPTENIRR